MRICILGASNCVETMPFPQAFKHNLDVDFFENYSLGGSTSVLAFKNLGKVENTNFDYVILDFAINETVSLERGATSTDSLSEIIETICARIVRSRAIPVIIIFPQVGKKKSPIAAMYRELSNILNLPLFDLYEVIEYLQGKFALDENTFYRDKNHISDWFSTYCAKLCIESLKSLEANFYESKWQFKYIVESKIRSLVKQPDEQLFSTIKTSIITEEVIKLEPNTEICLNIPKGAAVIGYTVDFANSSSFLRISGKNEIEVDLGTANYNAGRKHVLFSLPLKNGINENNGAIKIIGLKEKSLANSIPCYSQWKLPNVDNSKLDGITYLGSLILKHSFFDESHCRPSPSMRINILSETSQSTRDLLFLNSSYSQEIGLKKSNNIFIEAIQSSILILENIGIKYAIESPKNMATMEDSFIYISGWATSIYDEDISLSLASESDGSCSEFFASKERLDVNLALESKEIYINKTTHGFCHRAPVGGRLILSIKKDRNIFPIYRFSFST